MADAHVPDDQLPDDVHVDYANAEAEAALAALQAEPDYVHLAAFLNAIREGHLVVDVTGTSTKKRGPRVRTIRSTKGQLVLPIFTSMAQLRSTAPAGHRREEITGVVMPAKEALALIASDRFVAAEFNKASASFVILRKYVTLAASDQEITPDLLEAAR